MLQKTRREEKNLRLGRFHLTWELMRGKRPGATSVLRAEEMQSLTVKQGKGEMTATWTGHRECGKNFTVEIRLKKTGMSYEYDFQYSGNEDAGSDVEQIRFPILSVPVRKGSSLLLPNSQGRLIHPDWEQTKENEVFYEHHPYPFQFCALLNQRGTSYYFDTRDSAFYAKKIRCSLSSDRKRICFCFIHEMPLTDENRKSYKMPYGGTFQEFQGFWYQAAEIYKSWVRNQFWFKQSISKENRKLRNVGFWMWNRGNSDIVIPPVLQFQKDSGIPAALDWYWWHSNPYDTDYPDFWPPREGVKVFQEKVSLLNRAQVYSQVYTNGMSWDLDGKSWNAEGERSAVRLRNGEIRSYPFNRFNNHRLATMCGEGAEYQKKMRLLVRKLRESGLSGVYLDMIGCTVLGLCCFHEGHRHTPGGGCFMTEGYRAFIQKIRKENPGVDLSTEDVNEAFLDLFDSFIVLAPSNERQGEEVTYENIPVFSALYHGHIAMFGNYDMLDGIPPWDPLWPDRERWKEEKEWEKIFPEQFYLELARGVIWGMQPSIHNFRMEHATEKRFRKQYDFMIRTARFYYAHRDFLYDGEMLDPGILDCKQHDVEFMVRTVFTKEGEYKVLRKHNLPTVLHSFWRAPDGRKGLILANTTEEEQHYHFRSGDFSISGSLPPHSWGFVEPTEKKTHGQQEI